MYRGVALLLCTTILFPRATGRSRAPKSLSLPAPHTAPHHQTRFVPNTRQGPCKLATRMHHRSSNKNHARHLGQKSMPLLGFIGPARLRIFHRKSSISSFLFAANHTRSKTKINQYLYFSHFGLHIEPPQSFHPQSTQNQFLSVHEQWVQGHCSFGPRRALLFVLIFSVGFSVPDTHTCHNQPHLRTAAHVLDVRLFVIHELAKTSHSF